MNGIFLNGSKKEEGSVPISHGTELRIGETTLRFIDPSQPVEPTLPLDLCERTALPSRIHIWHACCVFVCSLVLSALQGYFFQYSAERSPFLKLLLYGVITALALWLPWAAIWALVGRVVQRRAHFSAHLTAVALASYLLGLLWLGAEYVEFAFGAPTFGMLLTFTLFAIWGFALLRFHLSSATRLSLRFIRLASGGVISVIIGLVVLYQSTDALDFSDELPLQTTIKPRAFKMVKSLPVEEFVAKSSFLEADLREFIDRR